MSMKSFSDTIGNRTAQYLNQLHYREPFAWGDWGKQWKALVVTDAQGRLDVNHSIASYVNHSIASYVNHSIASYVNHSIASYVNHSIASYVNHSIASYVNHSIASYVNHSIASYVNHSIASYFNPQIMYSFWPSRSKQPLVHFIYGILSWIIIPSFLLL